LISIALELVFWLVPQFVVSAIAIAFLGFFTGPLFPGALVVAAKLLPKHLHTPGIGLASSLAGGGGAMYVEPLSLVFNSPVMLMEPNYLSIDCLLLLVPYLEREVCRHCNRLFSPC
jgi:fucose permease